MRTTTPAGLAVDERVGDLLGRMTLEEKARQLDDLGAIRRFYNTHHVVATPREAVQLALNSGVDMQFYDVDHATFQNTIIDGINWVTVPGLHLLISTNITINSASGAGFDNVLDNLLSAP